MKIAVNLLALRPGENGGAEVYIRNLILSLLRIDTVNEYLLFTAPWNDASIAFDSSRCKKICLSGLSTKSDDSVNDMLAAHTPKYLYGYIPSIKKRLHEIPFVRRLYHQLLAKYDKPYLRSLQAIMDAERVDLLFCPFGNLEPRYGNIPSVVTVHDLQHEYYPEFFDDTELVHRKNFYRTSCELATKIIAVSQFTKNSILAQYRVPEEKISVVYETIHPRFSEEHVSKSPIRQKYGIDFPYMFFPGNTWHHKNHLLLLMAFYQFKVQDRTPIHLVFCGSRSTNGETVSRLINHLGLGESVHHLGFVPDADLPTLYENAKCLIFPSLFEGFGIPVLEAMSMSCPMALANIGSLPEIAGESAVYFDPRNFDDILNAMRRLVGDSRLCDRLKASGLLRIKEFGIEKSARGTLAVFEEASRSPSADSPDELLQDRPRKEIRGVYDDRWIATQAAILFNDYYRFRTLVIEAHAPDVPALFPMRAVLTLNGVQIGECVLKKSGDYPIECLVPGSLQFRGSGLNDLRVSVDKSFVPSRLGLNEDTRELSLRVISIVGRSPGNDVVVLYS